MLGHFDIRFTQEVARGVYKLPEGSREHEEVYFSCVHCCYFWRIVRDWSLITGRRGYKMGKLRAQNFLRPPLRQGKTFRAPLLKSGNFLRPPFNMAKTSSYHVETTPKRFVTPPPPSAWLKVFPTPVFIGVKLHMPAPLLFCSPPCSP